MARPRILTDQERLESNRRRQARWRKKHEGFARLKVKNDHARRKKERAETVVQQREVAPAKREPRIVQETERVSFAELEGDPEVMAEQRAMMEKFRPPARKEPGVDVPWIEIEL
jgi:hypothetical protein